MIQARSDDTDCDLKLVRASLAGDRAATDTLIERFGCVPRIVAALNHKIGRPLPDAELADIAQDVTILVWDRRVTFEGRARLETWLYRFCYLELMNHLRKFQRRKTLSMQDLPGLDERLSAPPHVHAADYEGLEHALTDLGPPDEDVIRLKHYEGLTFREIGERLAISPNTAKTSYYRGIDWLRERLAPEVDGSPR